KDKIVVENSVTVLRFPMLARYFNSALRRLFSFTRFTLYTGLWMAGIVFGSDLKAQGEADKRYLRPEELKNFVENTLNDLMDEYHIPGAVVAITEGRDTVLLKGYGYADIDKKIAIDPEKHVFRIASVSKLFTWTSVMQLVERGQLDLHVDINQYLDFNIPNTFEQPITLWHLLTHTPGFEDTNIGGSARSGDRLISLGDALKAVVPKRVVEPGERTGYSNYGAALAGYIVERVSGVPFYDYVEREVFKPLGMTRSSFRQPVVPGLLEDLVTGYSYDEGEYSIGHYEFMKRYPDGGMLTTAPDMTRFAKAHLVGQLDGISILRPDTLADMHSRQFANIPQVAGMTLGFIEAQFNGHRIIAHGGDINHYTSKLFLIPEKSISVFISFNSDSIGATRALFIKRFMDRFFPPVEKGPVVFSDAPLEDATDGVEGTYVSSRRNFTTIEKIIWPLMTGVSVERVDSKQIKVSFAGDTYEFERSRKGVYVAKADELAAQADLGTLLFTENPDRRQRALYFSRFASFAFEETSAIENLKTNAIWLITSLVLLLLGVMAVLSAALKPRKVQYLDTGTGISEKKIYRNTIVVVFFSVVLVAIFILLIPNIMTPELLYGATFNERLVFHLPQVLLVVGLGLLLLIRPVFLRAPTDWLLRVGVCVSAMGLFSFLGQLHVWNLIGTGGIPNL
ncbi:MAG: serine hydrolase domain-containing protein, partial [Kordiimonas sp.]